MSKFFSAARKNAKRTSCYVCGKPCSSFCRSHSVPQFCLKKIATDGKVLFSGIQPELPYFGEDSGVKEAGTFQIICRECDSTLFQDYENPSAYDEKPSGKMLAQIAMKNYLQIISKRFEERELYSLVEAQLPNGQEFAQEQKEIIELDLTDYITAFNRAKIGANGHHDDWYYLCYYQELGYVVPFSFQGIVDMVCDFEDNIINDLYNMSPDYHTKEIHIAVFPLEKKSIVIMFVDSREKRYRNFYRQLKKLPLNEQLSAINYIIFSYSENVFLSKSITDDVLKNKAFLDVCQKCNIAVSPKKIDSALHAAIAEYSLSKRNEIPNLLLEEYALPTEE